MWKTMLKMLTNPHFNGVFYCHRWSKTKFFDTVFHNSAYKLLNLLYKKTTQKDKKNQKCTWLRFAAGKEPNRPLDGIFGVSPIGVVATVAIIEHFTEM